MSWEVCSNSGLTQDKCECLDCFPWVHRFKWICAEAENIDDVIRIIEEKVQFFKTLKEGGYEIDEPHDDYMLLIPPDRIGFYWARCKRCNLIYEAVEGSAERLCEKCKKKQVS